MLPVFDTITLHVDPLLVDRSILYPVIEDPPLLLGAVQERLICDDEIAVAVRPVGGCGGNSCVLVVADAIFDGELVPTEFIAYTL